MFVIAHKNNRRQLRRDRLGCVLVFYSWGFALDFASQLPVPSEWRIVVMDERDRRKADGREQMIHPRRGRGLLYSPVFEAETSTSRAWAADVVARPFSLPAIGRTHARDRHARRYKGRLTDMIAGRSN